jgi:hypothetical protein
VSALRVCLRWQRPPFDESGSSASGIDLNCARRRYPVTRATTAPSELRPTQQGQGRPIRTPTLLLLQSRIPFSPSPPNGHLNLTLPDPSSPILLFPGRGLTNAAAMSFRHGGSTFLSDTAQATHLSHIETRGPDAIATTDGPLQPAPIRVVCAVASYSEVQKRDNQGGAPADSVSCLKFSKFPPYQFIISLQL